MNSIGGSGSNSNATLNVDRRSQTQQADGARSANVASQSSEKAAAVVAPPAAAAVAEVQARAPAAAATVDAARARAAGNEDAARNRALARNDDANVGNGGSPVRRGLQRSADDNACPLIMDLVDRGEHSPADLLEEVRGKGSGKGIDYDGPNCAPDPNQVIEV